METIEKLKELGSVGINSTVNTCYHSTADDFDPGVIPVNNSLVVRCENIENTKLALSLLRRTKRIGINGKEFKVGHVHKPYEAFCVSAPLEYVR